MPQDETSRSGPANQNDAAVMSRRSFVKSAPRRGSFRRHEPTGFDGPRLRRKCPRALWADWRKSLGIGLGGYHIGKQADEARASQLSAGASTRITFMDNCWDYNGGSSEVLWGRLCRATATGKKSSHDQIDGRTKEARARQIDESLRRLQTDRIDLMQFHEVIRLEDPDRIFTPAGQSSQW